MAKLRTTSRGVISPRRETSGFSCSRVHCRDKGGSGVREGHLESDKVLVDVADLFGLSYWPPVPALLISTISPAGTPHVSPFSLVMFTSYANVAEHPQTPKIIS